MSGSLKERLRYIQSIRKTGGVAENNAVQPARENPPQLSLDGWTPAGFQAVKKEIDTRTQLTLPSVFPLALPVLVPDMTRHIWRTDAGGLSPENLLFFDLETTGLSGGAGTVAFLAAFGRLLPVADNTCGADGVYRLRVTQYLLLDYPGESDFLDALLPEFSARSFVVSYNGKSFDSQILKTRCLMNGIKPPEYLHADLLHPARRLWKNVLENCSQSTIEEKILDIDRSGDVPGAQAPEIWFDFLRTGNAEQLEGICDHNVRDIQGLASIFAAMSHIAVDPLQAIKKYRYDAELLALRWRDVMRSVFSDGLPLFPDDEKNALKKICEKILCFAADSGGQKAALVYALDLTKSDRLEDGRERLRDIAAGDFPVHLKARALRSLSIDAERRLRNPQDALDYALCALELPLSGAFKIDFERRRNRLLKKINHSDL